MTLFAENYAERPRDPVWERELANELRPLSEAEKRQFLDDLLYVQPVVALSLARKCLTQTASFEALLDRGLKEADASGVRVWLECVVPRLGLRRVLRRLGEMRDLYPQEVQKAKYWLPEYLKGSGCTTADLESLGKA